MCGLKGHACLVGVLLKGHTELKEPEHDVAEVLKEETLVGGVLLDPWVELLVVDESHVSWEHHEGLGGLVFVLFYPSQYLLLFVILAFNGSGRCEM